MDREAFVVGESVERGLEGGEPFAAGQLPGRRERVRTAVGSNRGVHGVALVATTACRGPAAFANHELRDAAEPGPKPGAVVEGVEFSIGTDEDLLGRVVGVGRRPARSTDTAATTEGEHQGGMAVVDPPEGVEIPGPDRVQIMAVVRRHHWVHGRSPGPVSPIRTEFEESRGFGRKSASRTDQGTDTGVRDARDAVAASARTSARSSRKSPIRA